MTTYYTRQGSYVENTKARAETVKSDFDAIVNGFSDVDTDIKRAIKLPSGADIELTETAANRANKIIGCDASGNVEYKAVADISASLDTTITGVADYDALTYNSTTAKWENFPQFFTESSASDSAYTTTENPWGVDRALPSKARIILTSINQDNAAGGCTLNIGTTDGAVAIKKINSSGSKVDPAAGDLTPNRPAILDFDGTHWILQNSADDSYTPYTAAFLGGI